MTDQGYECYYFKIFNDVLHLLLLIIFNHGVKITDLKFHIFIFKLIYLNTAFNTFCHEYF